MAFRRRVHRARCGGGRTGLPAQCSPSPRPACCSWSGSHPGPGTCTTDCAASGCRRPVTSRPDGAPAVVIYVGGRCIDLWEQEEGGHVLADRRGCAGGCGGRGVRGGRRARGPEAWDGGAGPGRTVARLYHGGARPGFVGADAAAPRQRCRPRRQAARPEGLSRASARTTTRASRSRARPPTSRRRGRIRGW